MNCRERCSRQGPIVAYLTRMDGVTWFAPFLMTLFVSVLPMDVHAMTAQEILQQVTKQNFNDNFRVAVTVKAFKGNKLISNHSLWLIAKVNQGKSGFFVDFDEPKESKGLRFLFLEQAGQERAAYMYLPATGKTMPLAVDDPSVDVGGTGLTTEDLQGFIGKTEAGATVLKEETLGGRECYVIRIPIPETKGERLLWVSRDGFLVMKNQQLDEKGRVLRTFMVTEFFKTEQGKEFPKEEEIMVPAKGIRITVRQENAVFGIEIPDGVTDPEKFGTFQWKG